MIAYTTLEPDDDRPPESVLDWCRNLVRVIKHNGVWGIPRSNIVFKIDQHNKRLILQHGTADHPDFLATKHVFSYIGWDVVDTE